jgi:hypothetical protein
MCHCEERSDVAISFDKLSYIVPLKRKDETYKIPLIGVWESTKVIPGDCHGGLSRLAMTF